MNKINLLLGFFISLASLFFLCFSFYHIGQKAGRNEAKIKIVKKQVEVVRYVEKQKAKIYSKPNARRSELLKLMHHNQL